MYFNVAVHTRLWRDVGRRQAPAGTLARLRHPRRRRKQRPTEQLPEQITDARVQLHGHRRYVGLARKVWSEYAILLNVWDKRLRKLSIF